MSDNSNSAAEGNENLNGFMHVESPADISAGGGQAPVFIQLSDSANQEPSSSNVKALEDGGEEDMFADCPDELVTHDDKNIDQREEMEHQESQTSREEDDMPWKSGAENDSFAGENKDERAALLEALAHLRHQLKTLKKWQPLLNENEGRLTDHSDGLEIDDQGEKILANDASLHEIIKECSEFLKIALVEQHSEGTIRELHASLHSKDQEIVNLNARINSSMPSDEVQNLEAIANRMLASLTSAVNQEEILDKSLVGKMSQVENCTSLLIEKYNSFLSEINHLWQCLTVVKSDLIVHDEVEIFVSARDNLLDLKRKERGFDENLSHLIDENRKLVEQLEHCRDEMGRLNAEVEQERTKYANTKEKLSLAVTKGKALVQQRDSLKQSLSDKTSELEKCLSELQQKSSALEAAELAKEELLKSENFIVSLQEDISERDMILEKCKEILSPNVEMDGIQSMDIIERIRWLERERNQLKDVSLEFYKLRDAISSIDLPETLLSSNLESRISWLVEALILAKDEASKLQNELSWMREAADDKIDCLTASFLAENLDNAYFREELKDVKCKFKEVVEKEQRISTENGQIIKMLLEASGHVINNQEGADELNFDIATVIDGCLVKVKEKALASAAVSHVEADYFESIQTLLYVKSQESMLYEKILEEEVLDRSGINHLSNELTAMKDEKDSLQKDLERSEEKIALLRDKLSLAVKKGKGLVQDRDNVKHIMDEKNAEIEKLRLELRQQEDALSDYKEQIAKLLGDVECIPKLQADLVSMQGLSHDLDDLKHVVDVKNAEIEKVKLELQQQESAFNDSKDQISKMLAGEECIPRLEADLAALQNQRDQLEQYLVESNSMLQRVIESIDGIALPIDTVFEEPVEKMKWITGYFNECQLVKEQTEQELEKLKREAHILSSKLTEAQTTIKSLEDALSTSENKISQLAEEKKELEVSKAHVDQELQKAVEESSSTTYKLNEVFASSKSLEGELLEAEKRISVLLNEKEDAQVHGAAVEVELEKVKEEVSAYTSKLDEAYKTIQSLEDTLSQVQRNLSLIGEENNKGQVNINDLQNEITRLKEEAESQDIKIADSTATIKSLEDALLKAENRISNLFGDKKIAEQELSIVNSKLSACMQELAGTHGSMENRSLELAGYANTLLYLLKDESLFSSLRLSFEQEVGKLREMDNLLKDIKGHIVEVDSELLDNDMEEDLSVLNALPAKLDHVLDIEMVDGHMNISDGESQISYIGRTVEGFQMKNKIVTDIFKNFSAYIDEVIEALLKKLQRTREKVTVMLVQMKSLRQDVNNLEAEKQVQLNTIVMLENDITMLLSACADATQDLHFEGLNANALELSSNPELEELNHSLSSGADTVRSSGDAFRKHQHDFSDSKYANAADEMLSASRNTRFLIKQFQDVKNTLTATIEDLQKKLEETGEDREKALEESNYNQIKVYKLETDLEEKENFLNELRLELEKYQAKEDKLNEREVELSSMYAKLSTDKEAEDLFLSTSQIKLLFDKIDGIEIPVADFGVGEAENYDSIHVQRLFYIIDSVPKLRNQVTLLTYDNDELQSDLARQALENDKLKEEVEKLLTDIQDSEKIKNQLSELALGLESTIQKLGGDEFISGQNSSSAMGLLPVIEKLVEAVVLESENLKFKAQELSAKLVGAEKFADEMSSKLKSLEDSLQNRASSEDSVQETSIFDAPSLPTQSEISEFEDVGPTGKKAISPVTSAAHVRTLRKGSNDHLAINIDAESDRLINHEETNEDKGHVFKSLNTSGLIPRQGKMIADRIDGIWVSGDRALMSRPRARLGLVAYWLFLHLWLLGSLL